MASLHDRKGWWYGRHVYRLNGQRKEKWKSFETKDEKVARRRLGKWENELKATKWGEPVPLLFEEVARRFLLEHGRVLKPNTVRRYNVSLQKLVPFFAGRRLDSISRSDLISFESRRRNDPGRSWAPGEATRVDATGMPATNRRRTKISEASIRRDLACLSSILSFAIAHEWIEHNPVPPYLKGRRKVLKEGKPRDRYLSLDEERRLLAAVLDGPQANRNLAALHWSMIVFAIETGLRLEEQLGLEWRDVQLSPRPYLALRETKAGEPQKVPLTDRAQEVLRERPQHPTGPFVFWWGKKGARIGNMTRAFKSALKRARIEGVTWHDLRRTCGCRLLQEYGATIYDVKEWLRHSSVTVTERHYAFLRHEDLHRLIDRPVQLERRPPPGVAMLQGSGNVPKKETATIHRLGGKRRAS